MWVDIIVAWRRRVMNGVVVDAPQGPLHVSTVHQYTQETLLKGMDKRQSDDTTPSGISPWVRGQRPRDPVGSNGVSLARGDIPGLEDVISPNTIGSLQGLQQQNNSGSVLPWRRLQPWKRPRRLA